MDDDKTTQDDLAPDANEPGDALPDELMHIETDGQIVGDNVDHPDLGVSE
jgi:hypothetical protein